MVRAYVTVKVHSGDADRIRENIAAVEGVGRAHIVAGDIDLIAVVDVDSPAAVKDVAATHVQNIEGVADTQTYIAME
jgi:DNA-binding Lrp family transcriptional regulator